MKKNYECYSYYLMKFLLENNQVPVSVSIHNKTKKTFWQYEITDTLSQLLTEWSNRKKA